MTLSTAQTIDLLMTKSIVNGENANVIKLLEFFPLENMKEYDSNNLLQKYLLIATKNGAKTIARTLIDVWNGRCYGNTMTTVYPEEKIYTEEEFEESLKEKEEEEDPKEKIPTEFSHPGGDFRSNRLPLLTYMFLDYVFTDDVLAFLADIFKYETTFMNHLEALIYYDQSSIVGIGIRRLVETYGDLTYNEYAIIFELAESNENELMQTLIGDRIKFQSPYSDIPLWVKNFFEEEGEKTENNNELTEKETQKIEEVLPTEELLPTEEELFNEIKNEYDGKSYEIPSRKEFVDKIFEGLSKVNLKIDHERIEEARFAIERVFAMSTNEEFKEMIGPVIITEDRERLDNDVEIFRILGPVNPQFNVDLARDHVCYKYGGCRMFTCNEFEIFDPDDDTIDENVDWFIGSCQYCYNRIKNRYHAIRRPLSLGGWVGCFCSDVCIKAEVLDLDTSDASLVEKMTDEVLFLLSKYGIQDRIVVDNSDFSKFINSENGNIKNIEGENIEEENIEEEEIRYTESIDDEEDNVSIEEVRDNEDNEEVEYSEENK